MSEDYRLARPQFGNMRYPIKARIWNHPERIKALENQLTPVNLVGSGDPQYRAQVIAEYSSVPGRLRFVDLPAHFSVDTYDVRVPFKKNRHSEVEYVDVRVTLPQNVDPNEKLPVILNLPTLQGWLDIFDGRMGIQLARQGFMLVSPILVDLEVTIDPVTGYPPARDFDRISQIEMLRARTIINYLETLPNADADRIGLIGFSRGSIAGALLLGLEHERIKAAFFGGGGMGIAEILAESRTELGTIQRNLYIDARSDDSIENASDYQYFLHNSLRYEPLLWAHRVPTDRVKMMIIENDTSVPTGNQYLMWEALGRPQHFVEKDGHVKDIMEQLYGGWMPFNGRGGINYINFFKEKLGVDQ